MKQSDFTEFVGLCTDLAGLYPKQVTLTPSMLAMMFRALSEHSLSAVRSAMDAHIKHPTDSKFFPMPGQLIGHIQGAIEDDGRPGPEEAWTIAITASDEARTLIWTDEIAAAWAACKPVMDMGDEVGARMAFKEVYPKLVAAARAKRVPMRWIASEGHDAAERQIALREAAARGRVVQLDGYSLAALPGPREPCALLLEGPDQSTDMPPDVRERLKGLRDRLVATAEAPSQDAAAKSETSARKDAAALAVAGYATASSTTSEAAPA